MQNAKYFNVYAINPGEDWITGLITNVLRREERRPAKGFSDIQATRNKLPPKLDRLTKVESNRKRHGCA